MICSPICRRGRAPFSRPRCGRRAASAASSKCGARRRCCAREVVDLMQIHNLVDWRTHLATLRRMKEAGDIRYIGITHYTDRALSELAHILETEPGIDFVQCGYSLAARAAERELLPVAAARGVAVIVNQPLGQGGLLRRVRGQVLPDWAREFDCASWAQLLLKYVLAEPAVTCVIPATRNPEHMRENLGAGFGQLPDQNSGNGSGRCGTQSSIDYKGRRGPLRLRRSRYQHGSGAMQMDLLAVRCGIGPAQRRRRQWHRHCPHSISWPHPGGGELPSTLPAKSSAAALPAFRYPANTATCRSAWV